MNAEKRSLLEILVRESNALRDERLNGEEIERLRGYGAGEDLINDRIMLRDQALIDLQRARDDIKEYFHKLKWLG